MSWRELRDSDVTHTVEFNRLKCVKCGKPHRRRKTFRQSYGATNVHPDGRQKTRQEIRAELRAEGALWVPPDCCAACE